MTQSPGTTTLSRLGPALVWGMLAVGSGLAWRFGWDADHHTLVEALSSLIALMVSALAVVRFSTQRRRLYLLVAVGFGGTAVMELFHTLLSAPELAAHVPSALDRLIPWSWLGSRVYLGLFMVLMGWRLLRERRGTPSVLPERVLVGGAVLAIALMQAFFALVPMGAAYGPGPVGRPQELIAGALMVWGLVAGLRARPWQPVSFVPWLLTAMGIGAAGQLFVMPFSTELFDPAFRIAHVFKMVSYSAVTLGLLFSAHAAWVAEAELSERVKSQRQRLAEILWSTDVGTWEWDLRTNRLSVNDRFASLFGYTPAEIAPRVDSFFTDHLHDDDAEVVNAGLAAHLGGETPHYETVTRLRHKDGRWVWTLGRGKVVERAEGGQPLRMSGTVQDVTERVEAQALAAKQREMLARDVATLQAQGQALSRQAEELARAAEEHRALAQVLQREVDRRTQAEKRERHRAQHDPLTDLPNRRFLRELGEAAVAEAAERGSPLALLFVDIDGFKEVNDRLGHEAGDMLLVAIAARLRSRVRSTDVVARVGGDEFVVLLPRDCTEARATQLAAAIVDTLAAPFDLHGESARVGASVGVALHPEHGARFGDLLRRADAAMYAVKGAGKGGWRLAQAPEPGAAPG